MIFDSSEQDSSEEDAPTSGVRGCVRCSLVKPEFFVSLTTDEFFRARREMDEMAVAFLPEFKQNRPLDAGTQKS